MTLQSTVMWRMFSDIQLLSFQGISWNCPFHRISFPPSVQFKIKKQEWRNKREHRKLAQTLSLEVVQKIVWKDSYCVQLFSAWSSTPRVWTAMIAPLRKRLCTPLPSNYGPGKRMWNPTSVDSHPHTIQQPADGEDLEMGRIERVNSWLNGYIKGHYLEEQYGSGRSHFTWSFKKKERKTLLNAFTLHFPSTSLPYSPLTNWSHVCL